MKTLRVRGRYLCWEDGSPFFYLGDTAWELFHRLDRREIADYMAARAQQGFTAVQAVLLAEFEGTTVPNAYGRLPLHCTDGLPDPCKPDADDGYSYWAHADYAIDEAAKHGLFVALLPTWGDKFNRAWGAGPEIFTPENAAAYGEWLARRYSERQNILWMLGGDRPLEPNHRAIIDAMAAGIRKIDTRHLITFHPPGATDGLKWVGDAPYIDFFTSQTGHGIECCYRSDEVMRSMRDGSPKPYMDSEPRYEDHPACFNDRLGYYWDAADVRQNAYWNVLAGACGHTYGNHCVWGFNRHPTPYFPFAWRDVLRHPGAEQIALVKKLRLSRDYFSLRPAPELLPGNFAGMGHMAAALGAGYAYVYSPLGVPFAVTLDPLGAEKPIRASWFDPRTGEEQCFAILPPKGEAFFAPSTQGKGCDWVLILDGVG